MLNKKLRVLWLCIVLVCIATGTEQAQAQDPKIPDNESLTALIRNTLIAFNHGNVTGNYSVLRDLAAPGFAGANTAADLALSFRSWRDDNKDIGIIAVLTPELSEQPRINDRGQLHVQGHFPTQPFRVNFEMLFQSVNGRWRLFGMRATTE